MDNLKSTWEQQISKSGRATLSNKTSEESTFAEAPVQDALLDSSSGQKRNATSSEVDSQAYPAFATCSVEGLV